MSKETKMSQEIMKVVRFHQHGGPEVLVNEKMPVPLPEPGEVLLRVEACGVNFADLVRRRGDYYPAPTPLPFNPGVEIVGTVERCGSDVDRKMIGKRFLAAIIRGGGYAQFALASARHLVPCPEILTSDQAVALFIQGLTAALVLRDAGRLKAGESVFVQGASGGVGSIAMQLARIYGAAHVFGGVGSSTKFANVLQAGADAAIDYSKQDWTDELCRANGGRGVDLMLDATSGELLHQGFAGVADFGRIVVYGGAARSANAVPLDRLIDHCQQLIGFFLEKHFIHQPQATVALLFEMANLVHDGKLKLQIQDRFALEHAADAHRLIEARQHRGKIIIDPWM